MINNVIEQAERDVGLVKQLGLNLQFVLNTHVHADHITGTGGSTVFFFVTMTLYVSQVG